MRFLLFVALSCAAVSCKKEDVTTDAVTDVADDAVDIADAVTPADAITPADAVSPTSDVTP